MAQGISNTLSFKVATWESKIYDSQEGRGFVKSIYLGGKTVTAKCCLITLRVASKIECAAYGVLAILSIVIYPVSGKPFKFFATLSSNCWHLGSQLKILRIQLALRSFPTYLTSLPSYNLSHPFINKDLHSSEKEFEKEIALQEGVAFLCNDVRKGIAQDKYEGIKSQWYEYNGQDLLQSLCLKAVYVYVKGDKRNDEIPDFFRDATKEGILALRALLENRNLSTDAVAAINNLDEIEFNDEKAILAALQAVAYLEFQGGSFLTTACLGQAFL